MLIESGNDDADVPGRTQPRFCRDDLMELATTNEANDLSSLQWMLDRIDLRAKDRT